MKRIGQVFYRRGASPRCSRVTPGRIASRFRSLKPQRLPASEAAAVCVTGAGSSPGLHELLPPATLVVVAGAEQLLHAGHQNRRSPEIEDLQVMPVLPELESAGRDKVGGGSRSERSLDATPGTPARFRTATWA
ncbi:MAG TPA: hypothetical protein VGX03_27430 [Candidatus Binatia bacterium]|nr:hypothetical protein [Candidatus Binatia bacterium]